MHPQPREAMEHLRRLLEHMAWADLRVGESLRAASSVERVELELYAHLLGAEEVWLARMQVRPARAAVWPEIGLEECLALAERMRTDYAEHFALLLTADLSRSVSYVNSAGNSYDSTIEDILLHVALHGAYHRGQIAQLLRARGVEPAASDYIALARGAPAAGRDSRR